MLTPDTAAKIDKGLAKLAEDQLNGDAPLPGEISIKEMARRCGVSEWTISKVERIALAKMQAALLADPEVKAFIDKKS